MKMSIALAALMTSAAFTAPSWAGPAEDLMAKAKCNKCHTDKSTKKGPSFADVAAKYKGKPDPTPQLVDLLKTGGKDDHDKVAGATDAELKAVVGVVLTPK